VKLGQPVTAEEAAHFHGRYREYKEILRVAKEEAIRQEKGVS
jgi:hypothetical protein